MKRENIRYLALGDSYTIGEGVQIEKSWPYQLVARLKGLKYKVEEVKILAVTGWRTDELSAAIDAHNFKNDFNLVSLLIGVNDQYQGRKAAEYKQQFKTLLKKAVHLAGNNSQDVIVLAIPDYSFTPFGKTKNPTAISSEIRNYNTINQRITVEMQSKYVDISEFSCLAEDSPEYLVSDELHPSENMYALWVEKVLGVIHPAEIL